MGATGAFEILSVDVEKRRIGVKAADEVAAGDEAREYAARQQDREAEGFGSLADKLRGALDSRKK